MDAKHASSGTVWLSEMSPTATENIVMFASKLPGVTKIIGAASEPQVQDLCNFLSSAGVNISGIGSNILTVEGAKSLSAVTHDILSDHYEITTFMAMAAVTGGEIKVKNAIPNHFGYINQIFARFGIEINYDGDTAVVKKGQKISLKYEESRKLMIVKAQPWPGLPVDILPLFMFSNINRIISSTRLSSFFPKKTPISLGINRVLISLILEISKGFSSCFKTSLS